MIRKILIPVAFTDYSEGLVRFGASLASQLHADLILINVIDERDINAVERISAYGYEIGVGQYTDIVKTERLAKFEQLIDGIAYPAEKVQFSFSIGDPAVELLRIAAEEEIDLIVMGVTSRDLRQLFTGSVAEKMFQKSPVTIVFYKGERRFLL